MSDKAPKVSICLPIFNAEKFIGAAVDSILSQTLCEFELLVADDGSSDGTQEIMQNYVAADKRIIYWRNEKNLGAVRNYNLCFSKSAGEYIKPFGADDIMHKEHLEEMIAPFQENERLSLVACARQIIDAAGTAGDIARSFEQSSFHDGKQIREESLRRFVHLFNLVGEPSCVLLKRLSLPADGFDKNYYHMTDLDMWMHVLRTGDLYYIADPLCFYRKHKDTTTSNNFRSLYYALDFLRLLDKNSELACQIYGSREKAYEVVAEHLGRFVNQIVDGGTVTLETISTNLLNSRNPLHVQSGIATGNQARPETLSDEEYFRLLALFALFKSGENAKRLDKTYADLSAQIESQRKELDAIYESRAWKSARLISGVAGMFKVK